MIGFEPRVSSTEVSISVLHALLFWYIIEILDIPLGFEAAINRITNSFQLGYRILNSSSSFGRWTQHNPDFVSNSITHIMKFILRRYTAIMQSINYYMGCINTYWAAEDN
jgi:hypothetical protein